MEIADWLAVVMCFVWAVLLYLAYRRGTPPDGRIVWIDTETTGLDPDEDEVLEVACVVTDMQGNEIGPRFHGLYFPSEHGQHRLDIVPDYPNAKSARQMHIASGLFDALLESPRSRDRDFSGLESFLKGQGRAYIAGFSVWYDRAMLCSNGVDLSTLHHRMIDVSSLELAIRSAGRPTIKPEGQVRHRAMDDSLAALDSYKRALGRL